jgi:hypothetical protein
MAFRLPRVDQVRCDLEAAASISYESSSMIFQIAGKWTWAKGAP